MKLKNLFGFTLLILHFSCINLVASETSEQLELYWQKDILQTIAQNFNSCSTIASLKRTCKWLDQNLGYNNLPPHVIEQEDYDMISDGLIATAHQNKQQDHEALSINNPQKRSESLFKLGYYKEFPLIEKKEYESVWDTEFELIESIDTLKWPIFSLPENMDAYRGVAAKIGTRSPSQALLNDNLILKILSSAVNPNIKDLCSKPLLVWACSKKNTENARLLLNNENIDPNIQYNFGNTTALHNACEHNRLKIVQLLLAHPKTDLNMPDILGTTALHRACRSGFTEIALLLLADIRIDPNIQDRYGYTALDYIWLATFATDNTDIIKQCYALGARYSWRHYVPHTVGISILALLISYAFYRIVHST